MESIHLKEKANTMFSKHDIRYMQSLGLTPESATRQTEQFIRGFPYACIIKPAIPGDGIRQFSNHEVSRLTDYYEQHAGPLKVLKFVPASGVATRMFKELFSFSEAWNKEQKPDVLEKFPPVKEVVENLDRFAFSNKLVSLLQRNGHSGDYAFQLVNGIISGEGLNYGNLPKALLDFHRYPDEIRTAFEEHLVEGAFYARQPDGQVDIHLTLTPEHVPLVEELFRKVKDKYQNRYSVSYHFSWSVQKPSTDTLAVNPDNSPFRSSDGNLVFRPAGHGALIENLNEQKADIIFIKNIDNVVPDRLKDNTVLYKKLIGGLLIELRNKIFDFLRQFESGTVSEELKTEIIDFYKNQFHLNLNIDISAVQLFKLLNRPVRVCGMVKNVGEPGGGPFWVKTGNTVSLQIVESSQVNIKDEEQAIIFNKASHFNPVDLVCSTTDYLGNKFDLTRFVDVETGFISLKSKDGKNLKALELPGLWNGAMSDWNTIFVDVPLITFNPVKTINDLLRPEHQPDDFKL